MNRLAGVTSPYLLQHADNPVDWWPWCDEAFEEARRRDVPVLLSVGYSACHWCHVMAHESFEDPEVAAYLNERFVAVKVDREERPDVDSVYMDAVQAATGQGGWPMTVFMTAEGEPFYFGTYFPPSPRQGLPSFRQVLEGVTSAWTERRDEVGRVAAGITGQLHGRAVDYDAPHPPEAALLSVALLGLTREFDERNGGFGSAPKFPPPMVLEFLLRHHARTGSEGALEMVARTCEAMARGGIHDQLAGGFARYAVDREWVVPHFEKMLYDNALLCRVYTRWWKASGSPLARRVALSTAEFMVRELLTEEGGFASALDADSATGPEADAPHREGVFYVWTPEQLVEALGPQDAALAAERFRVTEAGTFEGGASVLQLPGEDVPEAVRARLLDVRASRPRPGRDDKVIAAWNGLAIAALAETGACLERPDLVEAAAGAADLLLSRHLSESGRLARTSRGGVVGSGTGVLEDYADVAEGLHALYAVTGESSWLEIAGTLLEVVLTRFRDDNGALYDTADDAERLIRRPQDPTDGATPSGWTAAAGALLTHAAYTGSDRHRSAAERALGIVAALGEKAPRFVGWGLAVAEAALDGPREVAVVGPSDDPRTVALLATALRATAPGAVVAHGPGDTADAGDRTDAAGTGADVPAGVRWPRAGGVPLLTGRTTTAGAPTAYVCRHFVCGLPVTDPAALAAQLSGDEPGGE
ncbi:thioredoxin domain-containing protein [Streptomyces spiramenti]|uniref:Thioredoxin domain-containing protein n=1 Tax=Streptomyces spiramenti TaxID=2720606 RepID=A0ABX1AT94_9ACTN|nr:thioredoxin domain-containing protein [Streptomyces spiramenti]NJP67637.1 thioredoxin domain-containing protein [Streptomyces spiramenti]